MIEGLEVGLGEGEGVIVFVGDGEEVIVLVIVAVGVWAAVCDGIAVFWVEVDITVDVEPGFSTEQAIKSSILKIKNIRTFIRNTSLQKKR